MRKWTLYDAHLENGRGMICMSDDGYYIAYDKFYDEISFGKDNMPLIYFHGINEYKHEDTAYMLYKWERFITVLGIRMTEALERGLNKVICTRDYSSHNRKGDSNDKSDI